MELSNIKGLGPAKQEALRAAGIANVEDMAAIDLRKGVEIQGITQDALKVLKQRARRLLAAEGKPVPKAPYTKNGKGRKAPAPRAQKDAVTDFRKKPDAPTKQKASPAKAEKPGFLRRLLPRRR